MGVDLVLSLCLPPLHGASVLSPRRAVPDHDSLRRKPATVAAADSCSNPERHSDWKFHGGIDSHNHHQYLQNQLLFHQFEPLQQSPRQHVHPWQDALDFGIQSSRLGTGFPIGSESDKEREKQACMSLFSRNDVCPPCTTHKGRTAGNSISAEGAVAGVDIPLSLRMLKRKHQGAILVPSLSEVGSSLLNAFSSVMTMMKAVQSQTLCMWQQLAQQEMEGLLNQAHREMHISLLWLFQQVFASTPSLMVLVMVLLADFTAFSVLNNVSVLPMSVNTQPASIVSLFSNNVEIDKGLRTIFNASLKSSPSFTDEVDFPHGFDVGWTGNGGKATYRMAGKADDGSNSSKTNVKLNGTQHSVDDRLSTELSLASFTTSRTIATSEVGLSPSTRVYIEPDTTGSDFSSTAAAQAFEEFARADVDSNQPYPLSFLDEEPGTVQYEGIHTNAMEHDQFVLDQMPVRNLAGSLTVKIEDDKYTCYDKTDLVYQDAISNDANNSLLLANYAQFLFLVRKDHDRAEEFFQKALVCDPHDSDVIGRFANFLWLARHNLAGANKAYQAALRADPTNGFHAANYAHFLWNSGS